MVWWKRILLLSPFAVAALLTLMVSFPEALHFRGQRVAGYAFVFGTPWAWMLEHSLPEVRSRFWQDVQLYAVVLWIPALMYSLVLWGIVRGIEYVARQTRK